MDCSLCRVFWQLLLDILFLCLKHTFIEGKYPIDCFSSFTSFFTFAIFYSNHDMSLYKQQPYFVIFKLILVHLISLSNLNKVLIPFFFAKSLAGSVKGIKKSLPSKKGKLFLCWTNQCKFFEYAKCDSSCLSNDIWVSAQCACNTKKYWYQ